MLRPRRPDYLVQQGAGVWRTGERESVASGGLRGGRFEARWGSRGALPSFFGNPRQGGQMGDHLG
jgi:hypothetical protein